MKIRTEQESDTDEVYSLNTSAFGREAEAELINTLRTGCKPAISLVAVDEDNVITGQSQRRSGPEDHGSWTNGCNPRTAKEEKWARHLL